MLQALFITGTDTGVGKTFITALLTALYLKAGKSVCVYKPVQTGCPIDETTGTYDTLAEPPDIDTVRRLVGRADIPAFMSYCFDLPVAPYAADAQRKIKPERILADFQRLSTQYDCVLVEGAGGVRVPIAPDFDTLDLIRLLDIPALVVARPDLGTINHTLLTVSALQAAQIDVPGVIISGGIPPEGALENHNNPAVRTLRATIEPFLNVPILGVVPTLDTMDSVFDPETSTHLAEFASLIQTLRTPAFTQK